MSPRDGPESDVRLRYVILNVPNMRYVAIRFVCVKRDGRVKLVMYSFVWEDVAMVVNVSRDLVCVVKTGQVIVVLRVHVMREVLGNPLKVVAIARSHFLECIVRVPKVVLVSTIAAITEFARIVDVTVIVGGLDCHVRFR